MNGFFYVLIETNIIILNKRYMEKYLKLKGSKS